MKRCNIRDILEDKEKTEIKKNNQAYHLNLFTNTFKPIETKKKSNKYKRRKNT